MADKIIAPLALLLFIVFIGFIAVYVPEVDLIIVLGGVAALAIYDFWTTLRSNGNNHSTG